MVAFGFTIPQRGALFGLGTVRELLELGVRAERSGTVASLWVGDSLTAKPRPESVALLGALAGMTEHVRLGVGCMASFPVRDPAQLAYQWATLDQVSQGRMVLAACTGIVGAGGASRMEGGHWGGVKDSERAARMEENMAICRALWTGEAIDFEGRFHRYHQLRIEPRPVQDPCPIWIAANPSPGKFFERSMRRVATLADGWMTCHLWPKAVEEMWTEVRRHLPETGKDAAAFPVMAYHNVNIGSDRQECLAESKRFLDAYYGPVFNEAMTESWTAAGTPEECAAQLRGLVEQGTTEITLRVTSWDQAGQLPRLVEDVLPRLID